METLLFVVRPFVVPSIEIAAPWTGVVFTQIVPVPDPEVMEKYGDFANTTGEAVVLMLI